MRPACAGLVLFAAIACSGRRAAPPTTAGGTDAHVAADTTAVDPSPADASAPDLGLVVDAPGEVVETARPDAPAAIGDVAQPGSAPDLGTIDLSGWPELGGDTYQQPGEACTTMSSPRPFGCTLRQNIRFVPGDGSPPMERMVEVQVYFPQGRVSGAPVVLVASDQLDGAGDITFASRPSVLAADGGASSLSLEPEGMSIEADLLPGAGGLRAMMRLGRPIDAPYVYEGFGYLRPAGEAPPATLAPLGREWISPRAGIEVRSRVPLDPATVPFLGFTDGEQWTPVVGYEIQDDYGSGELAWGLAVPPDRSLPVGRPLSLDARRVIDLIGRPVRVAPTRTLVPSADVSDLSFATPPPVAALASSFEVPHWPVVEGKLVIPPASVASGQRFRSYTVVLGLGEPPAGARDVRVPFTVNCSSAYAGYVRLTLVDARGASAFIDTHFCQGPIDALVAIPGPGRLFAVVDHVVHRRSIAPPVPGVPMLSSRRFEIDAIRFE